MDPKYWESVGESYEHEIFDSAKQDTGGAIVKELDRYADREAIARDFGCGIGHYLPLLASRFRSVYGVDVAHSLVMQARHRYRALPNIAIEQGNLASGRAPRGPRARFGVCANVLISAEARARRAILHSVHQGMVRGGHVLFLVPSIESVLYANQKLAAWNRRLGWSSEEALASGLPLSKNGARQVLSGLVRIENVPTKHYLREEAVDYLQEAGFAVVSSEKVVYRWDTEFEKPPRWMGEFGPWDWLLMGQRR